MRRLQFWFSLAEILTKNGAFKKLCKGNIEDVQWNRQAIHFWSGMASILTWASRITNSGPTPERRVMMHRNRRKITELSMTLSFIFLRATIITCTMFRRWVDVLCFVGGFLLAHKNFASFDNRTMPHFCADFEIGIVQTQDSGSCVWTMPICGDTLNSFLNWLIYLSCNPQTTPMKSKNIWDSSIFPTVDGHWNVHFRGLLGKPELSKISFYQICGDALN